MLCLFLFLNLHQNQSCPPGRSTQARNFIIADTRLAELGWNFSQTVGRWARPMKEGTAWLGAASLRSKSTVTELEQANKQQRMAHRGTLQDPGSSLGLFLAYVAPVHFVIQTGPELVTLDLILGLRPAATHSTRRPLKYRRESDPSTTSSPAHSPAPSQPLRAPTRSLVTSGALPPTRWYRRRQLRPHHPDGVEWYTVSWVSVTTPGQRYAARERSVH